MDKEEIRAKADIVLIASAYTQLTKVGAEFRGLCPFHSERTPSFYVVPDKGICTCFGGCGTFDVFGLVMKAEGLSFPDAAARIEGGKFEAAAPVKGYRKSRAPRPARVTSEPPDDAEPPTFTVKKLGTPIAVWPITNVAGKVIGYETRYEVEGRKEPRVWTWDGKRWGMGQFYGLRPLYGLHTLAQKPGKPVIISEGPKKAAAIAKLLPMYASVSLLGGCNSIGKHDWSSLAGRRIVIWPDADMPGRQAALSIAQILSDPEGLALQVSIIHPNGQSDGWDAADALAEGWTTEETVAWCKPRAVLFQR